MERVHEVTQLLGKLKEVVTDVHRLLEPERVTYELVRGDTEAQIGKKDKLLKENEVIQRQIDASRGTADSIIQLAKEEGMKITIEKEKVLTEAITLLETVKQFVTEVDRDRFGKHLEKIHNLKEDKKFEYTPADPRPNKGTDR